VVVALAAVELNAGQAYARIQTDRRPVCRPGQMTVVPGAVASLPRSISIQNFVVISSRSAFPWTLDALWSSRLIRRQLKVMAENRVWPRMGRFCRFDVHDGLRLRTDDFPKPVEQRVEAVGRHRNRPADEPIVEFRSGQSQVQSQHHRENLSDLISASGGFVACVCPEHQGRSSLRLVGQRRAQGRRSHGLSVVRRRQRPVGRTCESPARASQSIICRSSPGALPSAGEPSERKPSKHQQDHRSDASKPQYAAGANCRRGLRFGAHTVLLRPSFSSTRIGARHHVVPEQASRFNFRGTASRSARR
jgi:hypothetical protein